jgi:hypothetical protein
VLAGCENRLLLAKPFFETRSLQSASEVGIVISDFSVRWTGHLSAISSSFAR